MNKKLLSIMLLCTFLFFTGCGEKNLEQESNTQTSDKEYLYVSETDKYSSDSEATEIVSHYFNGNTPDYLAKPVKATVIATFAIAMGKEPVYIPQNSVNDLLDLFNSMQLEGFDYDKSTIPELVGGGYQIKLYYEDEDITIVVYSKDFITIQKNQGNVEYYADTSETSKTFSELIDKLAAYLA